MVIKGFIGFIVFFYSVCTYAYTAKEHSGHFHIKIDTSQSRLYFEEGEKKRLSEDCVSAIDYFSKAIALNPYYDKAYKSRAFCHYGLGNFEKAVEDFNQTLNLDPKSLTSLIYRGDSQRELGNYIAAMDDLSKVIASGSTLASKAYKYRGMTKYSMKDYKGSIEDFNEAILMNPNKANYYYNRAFPEMALKEYEKAISDFTKSIDLDPEGSSFSYLKRGMCKEITKDFPGAIDDYGMSIFYNENYDAYIRRAALKFNLKNYKGTLTDYENCLRIDPGQCDALFYNKMGNAYLLADEYEEAIKKFNESLQMKETCQAYAGRGGTKLKLNDYKGAAEDFKKSMAIEQNGVAYEGLCAVQLEQKDYKKALNYINKSILLDSNNIRPYFTRAFIKSELNDVKGAISDLNKILALDPFNSLAYIERAILNENVSDINKSLAFDSLNNPRAYQLRAMNEMVDGDYEKALADYNKLLVQGYTNAEDYAIRAFIHLSLNNIGSCIADINRAIELEPNNSNYYYLRAMYQINDLTVPKESLLKDINKAIELDKKLGNAYWLRAIIKSETGDQTGACMDAKMAVKLGVEEAKDKVNDFCNK